MRSLVSHTISHSWILSSISTYWLDTAIEMSLGPLKFSTWIQSLSAVSGKILLLVLILNGSIWRSESPQDFPLSPFLSLFIIYLQFYLLNISCTYSLFSIFSTTVLAHASLWATAVELMGPPTCRICPSLFNFHSGHANFSPFLFG